MAITGEHFIAGQRCAARARRLIAVDPVGQRPLDPAFAEANADEIDRALTHADAAYDVLQTVSWEQLAAGLDAIGAELTARRSALVERAHRETALPIARLEGEHERTVRQARLFAAMVRDGSWMQARIDHAAPDRTPAPKPDVRSLLVGVGPVVVFGASNFPLAISVAGTDTVAALAARCPVVVKAHPGHPGTCELAAEAVVAGLASAGLPAGAFSLLQGAAHEVGRALAAHPLTAAVAFTGSLRGGRALADVAAARPHPIPVYAEMGSVNPLFILPGAAAARPDSIAAGYIESVTLGVGQFCTNPGVVLSLAGEGHDRFLAAVVREALAAPPAPMLHAGIHAAFGQGVARLASLPGVVHAAGSSQVARADRCEAPCTIFTADAAPILSAPELWEEVFGPASIVVRCQSIDQMYEAAARLQGNLAAAIHGSEADLTVHSPLVRLLRRRVGRLVFNGFPTGLEVCPSLHHGGPYPATTHSHFTSVGQAAIYRFVRPVCYQNFPDAALPPELQEGNPRGLDRLVDGRLALGASR